MDEEAIFAALADLMEEVRWTRSGGPINGNFFRTKSRRVKLFSDVPQTEQPACFQAEHAETTGQTTNMPYKDLLEANWIIYQAVAADPNAIGAIENNLIIRGVKEALKPKPSDPGFQDRRNTLGGLVHHCFIQGKIFKDPGDIDGQGMIVVPIKILVP